MKFGTPRSRPWMMSLSLCALVPIANAQITITASDYPGPGQTEIRYQVEPGSITEGASGAGQTWDFSAAIPDGEIDTTFYFDAAGTEYASSYPQANLALTFGANDVGYLYALKNQDSLAVLGFASAFFPETAIIYNDPLVAARLPMQFGGTVDDTWDFTRGPFDMGGGIFVSYHTQRVSTYTVDGYGTLTAPQNGPSSALRLKLRYTNVDSTIYSGAIDSLSVRITGHTQFAWKTSGSDGFGFNVLYDTTWTDGIADPEIDKRAAYTEYGATPIGIIESEAAHVDVAPNPTTGLVSITPSSHSGSCTITFRDAGGRCLRAWNNTRSSDQLMCDLSTFDAGVYTVEILYGNGIRALTRIVKQ